MQVGKLPVWNFDGSSTNQADTGNSDRILKPVRVYTRYGFPLENSTVYVLCEVMNSDGKPHESNMRAKLNEEEEGLWFGFEQEYFIREEIKKVIWQIESYLAWTEKLKKVMTVFMGSDL